MKNTYYIVDRIEDNYAVIESSETKKIYNISLNKLPKDIKDGDVIILKDDIYVKNDNIKAKRIKEIQEKFKELRGE